MKKYFLTLVTLLVFLGSYQKAHSQAALFVLLFGDKVASEKFHLSLDAGVNISGINRFDDGKTLIAPNFGLGTHIKLNDRFSLNPEFKPLSRKGAKDVATPFGLPSDLNVSSVSSDLILNYIEVPVLLRYYLDGGWYLSAGPQFSFLTSAKQKSEVNLVSGTKINIEEDIDDNFNSFNWSFPVEIGYSLVNKREGKGIDLRLRYSYGFNDVFENASIFSANHSTFQFIVTLPFIENGD